MNITLRIALLATLGLFADSGCIAREPPKEGAPLIRMYVVPRHSNAGKAQLDIDFEYLGDKPARVFESNLPWGIRRSLLLVAICLDGQRSPIAELEYIDDPTPSVVSLQPGQKSHGSIDLSDRFPKLRDCLVKRDALIFWSYEFEAVDASPSPRVNGGVQLSRR